MNLEAMFNLHMLRPRPALIVVLGCPHSHSTKRAGG